MSSAASSTNEDPACPDVPRCNFTQGCRRFEFPSTMGSPELKDPGAPDKRLQAGGKFKTFVPLKTRTVRNLSSAGVINVNETNEQVWGSHGKQSQSCGLRTVLRGTHDMR